MVKHLRRGTAIDVRVQPSFVLSRKRFWAEAIVVALHLPPMCTGEIRAWSLNNISVHRLETILAVINTLRCAFEPDPWHSASTHTGAWIDVSKRYHEIVQRAEIEHMRDAESLQGLTPPTPRYMHH